MIPDDKMHRPTYIITYQVCILVFTLAFPTHGIVPARQQWCAPWSDSCGDSLQAFSHFSPRFLILNTTDFLNQIILLWGTAVCIKGCLAVLLASTQ